MRCPASQAENRAARRFCADCGAALAVCCPACQFVNQPGEEFCGGCGAALAAARAQAAHYERAKALIERGLALATEPADRFALTGFQGDILHHVPPNLGQLGRFWLERHAMFRRLDGAIRSGVEAGSGQPVAAAELRRWLGRHLRWFLWQLEEHHQVEDLHYFPVFRRLEPRLAAGFDLLERTTPCSA